MTDHAKATIEGWALIILLSIAGAAVGAFAGLVFKALLRADGKR
jgi:hypothetical protein